MGNKLAFGRDLLILLRLIEFSGGKKMDVVSDAAIRYFLITWGLSPEEVDEANQVFWDDLKKDNVPDFEKVIERFSKHIKEDQEAVEKFIVNCVAVAYLDGDVNEKEVNLVKLMSNYFDLRPSEFEEYIKKGIHHAIGLNYFGSNYNDNKK